MSQHTPGPWRVGGQFGIDVYAGDAIIAAVSFHQYTAKLDSANARLIAAAPELLAALKDMVRMAERTLGGINCEKQGEVPRARAAIRRAEVAS